MVMKHSWNRLYCCLLTSENKAGGLSNYREDNEKALPKQADVDGNSN